LSDTNTQTCFKNLVRVLKMFRTYFALSKSRHIQVEKE
jgi:hypothetical protein